MNPIPRMVALHRHRLARLERLLRDRRRRLAEQEMDRELRRSERDAHQAAVSERERALYARVLGCVLRPDAFDLLREDLMAIRREGQVLQERLMQSENACEVAAAQTDEARQAHTRQGVRTEKYLALQENADTAALHAQQVKEELELEDVPVSRIAR